MALLEDTRDDVLQKALAHHGLASCDVPDCPTARRIFLRERLQLDPDTLLHMTDSIPSLPLPDGLERRILPFGSWTVNVWTLETPGGLVAIDTGCSPDDFRKALNGEAPAAILVTHKDDDHRGGLGAFPGVPVFGPDNLKPGTALEIAGRSWTIHDLCGHTPDGLGYETVCAGRSLFFPGDSVFARSIGKSRLPYEVTIHRILAAFNSLADDTLICPGHGPATTAGDEKRFNPFLSMYY